MARTAPARPAAAGQRTRGARAVLAGGLFAAALVVSAVVDHWLRPIPQAWLTAWYAAAAVGAVLYAALMPRRAAPGAALIVALLVGVLVHSPAARQKADDAVSAAGRHGQHGITAVAGWVKEHL